MTSPYAAGLGGFMTGFAGGMNIGEKLRKAYDDSAAQTERDKAAKEARDAYHQQGAAATDAPQAPQPAQAGQDPQAVQPDAPVAVATPVQQRDMAVENLPPQDGSAAPAAVRQAQPAAGPQPMAARGIFPVTERMIETPRASAQGIAPAAPATPAAAVAQAIAAPAKTPEGEREAVDKAISARMRSFYVDKGDLAMADKWEQYADSQQGKREVKAFAGALKSYAAGDTEGFVKQIMPTLKNAYGEGFEMQKYAPVKNNDGAITGYNFEVRNKRTGEVTQNNIDTDRMYQLGMTMGAPDQVFARWMADQQSGRKAKADAAAKVGEMHMQTAKEIAVERDRQRGRVEIEGVKANNDAVKDERRAHFDIAKERAQVGAKLDAQIDVLRQNGMGEEELRSYVPRLVIGDAYKKGASPEEAARLAYDARMKSDSTFPRKTEKERQDIIESDIRVARTAAKNATQPEGAANPAAPTPATKGQPVLDKKTGQVIFR